MTRKKKNELVKKGEGDVAVLKDMEHLTGAGFEAADADSFAVPFLRILQTNSPQVNEDEDSYVEGAKPGMFFNTVALKHYGKKVKVIPIYFQRDFVEWMPNRGGFIRSHGRNPKILDRIIDRNENNQDVLDNGNIIQDHRNHYVLIQDHIEEGPIIFSLVSTGVRHSRQWMSMMRELKTPGGKQAPMFSSVYEISTVLNENDEGKWYQIGDKYMTSIKRLGWVTKDEWDAAKAAKELIDSGKTKADYESMEENKTDDDDAPF